MGGTIILLAMTIAYVRFADEFSTSFYILLIGALGFGLIGFLDDYVKIVFKRSLGLTAKQKLFGQLIVSVVICILLYQMSHPTDITIPIVDISFELHGFYYVFVILLMMGMSNAVNFTDGLDGLLAGTSAIAFGAFALILLSMTELEYSIFKFWRASCRTGWTNIDR